MSFGAKYKLRQKQQRESTSSRASAASLCIQIQWFINITPVLTSLVLVPNSFLSSSMRIDHQASSSGIYVTNILTNGMCYVHGIHSHISFEILTSMLPSCVCIYFSFQSNFCSKIGSHGHHAVFTALNSVIDMDWSSSFVSVENLQQ